MVMQELEVCTGLGLGLGLGLVAQIMFGSGHDLSDSNQKLHKTFRAFSGHSFFREEALFLSSLHSRAPETDPVDFILSWIFVPAFSQKKFCITPYRPGIWCLYRSSKDNVTSGVLVASLNNSFKDY
jgi:hypothetical protein